MHGSSVVANNVAGRQLDAIAETPCFAWPNVFNDLQGVELNSGRQVYGYRFQPRLFKPTSVQAVPVRLNLKRRNIYGQRVRYSLHKEL